ncbi:MAG: imidazole glycerol phosphate synthase subunit HisF [Gammaproteobacteria bacterium]|nr:imidazole glycerol phosphate synthase subunit HisF [Gammaproteobacteria bacterium]
MLTKRIIPCLDVRDGLVVKGVQFRNHRVMGDIMELAERYRDEGADELVFYDITASPDGRTVDRSWVNKVARALDVPFCVAGGIRTLGDAETVLNYGADKVSVNTPALENPGFVDQLVRRFGSQCVVIGVDTLARDGGYEVHQYTGDPSRSRSSRRRTLDWVREVEDRGAGEIVLNCMNQDGVRRGYDIEQLSLVRDAVRLPLIASGGAGAMEHFREVFDKARVDGALAASVFHSAAISIPELKRYLRDSGVAVRPTLDGVAAAGCAAGGSGEAGTGAAGAEEPR